MESRSEHVAIVIQDKLFCIGGRESNSKSSEYYSFETNCWQKGPELPFMLWGAKAVHIKKGNQCFLLGGTRNCKKPENISLFDPITGVTNIEGGLDVPHQYHIAVLI